MNPFAILKSFGTSLVQSGPRAAVGFLVRRARIRYREKILGIHTEAVVFLPELGIHNPDCSEYGATEYADFDTMMRELGIDPKGHVFLDYGAGMGRAVVLAAQYPFKRVLGVELTPELTKIANENLNNCRTKLVCKDVSVLCTDATTYVPDADVSVFYFNNPFAGEVLEKVLASICASTTSAYPRLLLCNLPRSSRFEELIRMKAWLRIRKEWRLSENRHCIIFAVEDSASSLGND